jgi:hypothetical protein
MSESRNIVVVLGNGFDLDLGLKTSYKDFWESEFCPKDYPAPIIWHLNGRWTNDIESVRWYDLENELLKYYLGIRDREKGDDFITEEEHAFLKDFSPYGFACGWYNDKADLLQSLVDKGVLIYRQDPLPRMRENQKEDCMKSPIWRDRKALRLIKEGLCKYLSAIKLPLNASSTISFQVLAYLDEEAGKGNTVNIYTFNYTRVQLNGRAPDYAQVHYLHGKCEDGKIIIGVRDDQELNDKYDFLQKSFDSSFNPPALVEDIKNADEIVIFGHSIGENDRQYFKAFFKQQTDYTYNKRKDITIFTRDDASEMQIKRALERMTDWNLSTLFGQNNIQIIKTANIKEDQQKLFDFLVKHGKDELATREFIGKHLQ